MYIQNVMATEIKCSAENCVPLETLVVIICAEVGSRFSAPILKPISQVEEGDISDELLTALFGAHYTATFGTTHKESTAGVVDVPMKPRNTVVDVQMVPRRESVTAMPIRSEIASVINAETATVIPQRAASAAPDTVVPVTLPRSAVQVTPTTTYLPIKDNGDSHKKGTRIRGCPCCDPDNIDNIVDRLLFLDAPP